MWLMALLLLGCGTSPSPCPAETCLAVELVISPAYTLSTVLVMVRDGEQLTRREFVGSELAAGAVAVPLAPSSSPSERRAVYVRADADEAGGRHELVGFVEGERSQLDRAVVMLSEACAVSLCSGPSPRRGAAMTYVPALRQILLHGGAGLSGQPLDDLWAWNGLWWQKRTADSTPPARSQHGLAFDEASGQVLLFGGQGKSGVLGDTWLLDPKTMVWQRLSTTSPTGRKQAALGSAPIGSSSGLLLFGGQDAAGEVLGDSWLWDGNGWRAGASSLCDSRPLLPSLLPRCRIGAALVPLATSRESLLIGGWLGPQPAGSLEPDEVIWRFDGQQWSVAPLYRPPFVLSRYQHGAATLQSSTGQSAVWVGLGDSSVGLRQDSYLLDESTGQFQPLLGGAPSPRSESAIAFDREREELVIFGGRSDAGLLDETYTFAVETGYQRHP